MSIRMHPRYEAEYRASTQKMGAINFSAFRCRCCGEPRPIRGRKKIVEGWICAGCAEGKGAKA